MIVTKNAGNSHVQIKYIYLGNWVVALNNSDEELI
jgi:hypothetical protein